MIIIGTGYNVCNLKLQYLLNPVLKFRYSSIYARLVFFGAADAPTDDSRKHESAVLTLHHHWSTTVALKSQKISSFKKIMAN